MVPIGTPVFTTVRVTKKGKHLGRVGKVLGTDAEAGTFTAQLDTIAATDTTPELAEETVTLNAATDGDLLR